MAGYNENIFELAQFQLETWIKGDNKIYIEKGDNSSMFPIFIGFFFVENNNVSNVVCLLKNI